MHLSIKLHKQTPKPHVTQNCLLLQKTTTLISQKINKPTLPPTLSLSLHAQHCNGEVKWLYTTLLLHEKLIHKKTHDDALEAHDPLLINQSLFFIPYLIKTQKNKKKKKEKRKEADRSLR